MTISETLDTILSYYVQPGMMSETGAYTPGLRALPGDIPGLVRTLQGLVLHVFWAERYNVHLSDERRAEVQIRPVQPKLARVLALDPRSFDQPRPPELRLVGNCRDFSLLLAAILKVHGIPSRARCGFGTYFIPGHFEDHWMTEYWNTAESRWVQVDAQLDELQQKFLGITFNPLDMPRGKFVLAGEAWRMCRQGEANPDDFGIFEYKGWDFIKGNVLRDLLSLNKIELLPWDFWGLTYVDVQAFSPEQMALLDRAAELTLAGNESFAALRDLYESNEILHIPGEWAA